MELTTKEWNDLLDNFLINGGVDMELFQRLDQVQNYCLNEIKKSINRIKNK